MPRRSICRGIKPLPQLISRSGPINQPIERPRSIAPPVGRSFVSRLNSRRFASFAGRRFEALSESKSSRFPLRIQRSHFVCLVCFVGKRLKPLAFVGAALCRDGSTASVVTRDGRSLVQSAGPQNVLHPKVGKSRKAYGPVLFVPPVRC
jgi:hypothetical protein